MGAALCQQDRLATGVEPLFRKGRVADIEPEPEGEEIAHPDLPPTPAHASAGSSKLLMLSSLRCSACLDDEGVADTIDVLKAEPVYTGEWKGQQWHGKGNLSVPGAYQYSGTFHQSQAHGQGIYQGSGGDTYEGQWYKDKKHGYGVIVHHDGTVYAGNWSEDEKSGAGVETWADGTRYKGEFWHDMRHGTGKYRSTRGQYDGQFRKDKMEGQGRYNFTSGRSYQGQWQDGVMIGHGTMEFSDGSKYDGNYERGVRHGIGTLIWPDGRSYHGEWAEGNQNGLGIMTNKDGSKVSGTWKDGHLAHEQDLESVEFKPVEIKITRWQVLAPVHVRALPTLEAECLGTKERGIIVKGNVAGDWLALSEETGFIATKNGGQKLLRPATGPRQS